MTRIHLSYKSVDHLLIFFLVKLRHDHVAMDPENLNKYIETMYLYHRHRHIILSESYLPFTLSATLNVIR